MNYKKAVSTVCALFMAGAALGVPALGNAEIITAVTASAETGSDLSVSVSGANVYAGDTGEVTVSMNNNPGIISWRFYLDYDSSVIEILSCEAGAFKNAACGPYTADPFCFSWSSTANGNSAANGTLAKIKFRVKDTAAAGNYSLKLTCDPEDVFDNDFKNVGVTLSGGTVRVARRQSPAVSWQAGDGRVKLTWEKVSGAQKYAVVGTTGGSWKMLGEGTGTSYILDGLTAGKKYKVAVIAMFGGVWYKDFSKAITVSPKNTAAPVVTYQVSGSQYRLKWTAVNNAEAYAVAQLKGGKWNVIKTVGSDTLLYTSPKLEKGDYDIAVAAKINGRWDTSGISDRKFTITIG